MAKRVKPTTQTDAFDTETVPEMGDEAQPSPKKKPDPYYQIYGDSKIAVSKAVGTSWQKRIDAARTAYKATYEIWDTVIRYYNNDQTKIQTTPRGSFTRGDSTENIIYSNLNIMLPAIYSKDPDISCSTVDEADDPFCRSLEALINVLLKRRDKLNAKPKIKKAAGMGLLTNFGIFKLEFTQKDDSREIAIQEMQRITRLFEEAANEREVERAYGQLAALEAQMETLLPSGPGLSNVMPHNLIVDPFAEQPDGLDGMFMAEQTYFLTSYLNARFTEEPDKDEEEQGRKLKYKSTHKAVFSEGGDVTRDDGLGLVMKAIGDDNPTFSGNDERAAYVNQYYTECCWVWDKPMRRLFLFATADWTWPIWVWDDPLKISRYFPYFIIGYGMATGGTVNSGEQAYILDQQDEINEINRQMAKIRRTIFEFWYYNSDAIEPQDAEKFLKALSGKLGKGKKLLGIKAGDNEISKMIQAVEPPSAKYESLFNKQPIIDAINRITNTSDALRGVQFKTNTNEASVNSYQESMRLSVGAKVDVIEDVVADLAYALGELAVQNYNQQDVADLIGEKSAEGWTQMSLEQFRTQYTLELVAGSMEKPNSVFKKKEAVEIGQVLGQFAQAAPGAVMMIMLRVLEQAFTEVVIKPEDWDMISQEVAASLSKGDSSGGVNNTGGGNGNLMQQAQQLPEDVKRQVEQMHQQGAPDQQIAQFIVQKIQEFKNGKATEPASQRS